MEAAPCVFLGIKVKPGPIERHKLENFSLDKTVDCLKSEAEKKTNLPSSSLELIHHGKILRDQATLQDSGVKSGEMIHVVKKKVQAPPPPPPAFSDAELQQLNASLRTLGCTPNASGWTRAMQLLNDEPTMNEIMEQAPGLSEDCVALSILHEVELLAALGANLQTMRRGAEEHPHLPHALRHMTRLVRSSSGTPASSDNVPTSGFAYSLEALSDDEEAEEETEEEGERTPITQQQLAAALQAATEAVSATSSRGGSQDSLLRLLTAAGGASGARGSDAPTSSSAGSNAITAEMFSEAISAAISRAQPAAAGHPPTPMDHSANGSSSESPARSVVGGNATAGPGSVSAGGGVGGVGGASEDFSGQLAHMHEMGLLDDALNVRALLIAAGDVNAAINLVFSGAITDD